MNNNTTTLALYLFIFLFNFICFDATAQNQIVLNTPDFFATYEHISVHLNVSGDDNLNSNLEVRYKLTSESNYINAAKTFRAHPNLIIDGSALNMNFHAGSVMHLTPDTDYDIQLIVTDPDGGSMTTNHIVATKKHPVPNLSQVKYVEPGNGGGSGLINDPYLGLQEAADQAIPGDLFLVTPGNYSPFILTTSGTSAAPISFISQELHQSVIDGSNTSTGIVTIGAFDITSQHIIIEGFNIRNGRWAIDAQNTQFVTFRNNIVEDVDYGYVNRRELGVEQDQTITNNIFIGRTNWPSSGIPGERGIDIRGNNNVVSFNTIRNFGDGISTDGPPYFVSYSLDIYNNDITSIVDDHIEVDGMISNTRIYNNRCFNARAGISIAPVFGGPVYIFRNLLFNFENSALKMNRGSSGIMIVNNTMVSSENAQESPTGWQNTYSRNNVALAARYCFELFGLITGSDDDWDFGAYYSTRGGQAGTEWFKWNNIRYTDVDVLSASNILESNALEISFADFMNINLPDPYPVEYESTDRNFNPIAGNPVINSGDFCENINDPYVFDGQTDRGALELGSIELQYGALFDDISSLAHIFGNDQFINIYPNPFLNYVVVEGEFANYDIDILDVNGQVVMQLGGSQSPIIIDLSSLGTGIYFIRLTNTQQSYLSVKKIIKGTP